MCAVDCLAGLFQLAHSKEESIREIYSPTLKVTFSGRPGFVMQRQAELNYENPITLPFSHSEGTDGDVGAVGGRTGLFHLERATVRAGPECRNGWARMSEDMSAQSASPPAPSAASFPLLLSRSHGM